MIYNTGETTEMLKNTYNPEGSDLRKAQMRMYEMLEYIDKVCKEQNIKYILDSGTVLGAVRHGGFIPWDDDLDLAFERNQWIRLVDYLKAHPHPHYVIQDYQTDNNYMETWAVLRDMRSEYLQDSYIHKIRKYKGLQIDLFPFDKGNLRTLQKIAAYLMVKTVIRPLSKGHRSISSFFIQLYQSILFPLFRCFNFIGNQSSYSHSYGTGWYKNYRPKDSFLNTTPIKFEKGLFPAPSNYDEYLKNIYGDYMKLPEEKNRNPHRAICKIW